MLTWGFAVHSLLKMGSNPSISKSCYLITIAMQSIGLTVDSVRELEADPNAVFKSRDMCDSGMCSVNTVNAISSSNGTRLMKRERVPNAHLTSDLYMQFESIKHKIDVGFVPETPKPSSYSNKRGWEKAMHMEKCFEERGFIAFPV